MSTPEALSLPRELETVTNLLEEHVDALAYGNSLIQAAALQAAKHIFDTSLGTERQSKMSIDNLLSSLNPVQKPTTRSQAKTDNSLPQAFLNKSFEPTPLSSLLIEGMDQDQVWMQLDLRSQMVCNLLDYALETGKSEEDQSAGEEEDEEEDEDDRLQNIMEAIQNGEEIDLQDIREELGEEMDIDEENVEGDDDESETSENPIDDTEHIVQLRPDEEQSDNEDPITMFDVIKSSSRSKRKKRADHGLNDDFFDLDAFNAETEQAEARSSSRGRLADSDSDSEDEDMTLDLFAPADEELDEAEESGDVFYRDFFDPPRNAISRPKVKVSSNRKSKVRFNDEVRVKKIKPKGKNLPLSLLRGLDALDEDDDDGDDGEADFDVDPEGEDETNWFADEPMEDGDISDEPDEGAGEGSFSSQSQASDEDDTQTMERFKDDLFAEDEEGRPDDDMTTHEKQQASLREQIAQLEDENVAKKTWTLMGEADSRSRPQNSLLEEDLEFERIMKAAPVISEEVVQGLEQRIKTRILDNRFDDVVRIRPLEDKPFLPSRMFELQDTKSTQSLAQIYENDYLESQSGQGSKRDEKVKKQHEEIEKEWEKICGKLDALCNAHFVPKQPKAVISTVSNVATASMESALPTAMATSSMLAPEELFNPARGETRTRSELTPSEKKALRTKERKAKKKQRDVFEKTRNKVIKPVKGIGNLKKEKQAALKSVVKTGKGVTVVGKQAKSSLSSSKKRPGTVYYS